MLRKTKDGKYSVLAEQKATSKKTKYVDENIGEDKQYVYSVRQIKAKKRARRRAGKYDKTGLALYTRPSVKVDFQNLKANITWTKSKGGASSYAVFRKIGKDGSWKRIATVSNKTTKYTDHYYVWSDFYKKSKFHRSDSALQKYLSSDVFVDPANNPVHYTVRAVKGKSKRSYGLYLRDGIFHLEPPVITDLTNDGTLTWGTVPNAETYNILSSSNGDNWTVIKTVDASDSVYQKTAVGGNTGSDYYAVQAQASENGNIVTSDYDTGFTKKNNRYSDTKVLFLGDSITFGSPYYGDHIKNFAFTKRISNLTGVKYFNPSIPGSTYHYNKKTNRYRVVNGVAGMVAEGENTDYAFESLKIGENTSKIEDYDIVVLSAGTNDYQDKYYPHKNLGSRERDWEKIADKNKTKGLKFTVNSGTSYKKTYTRDYDYDITSFDGAYNQIMKDIEAASLARVMEGKPAIKVVTVDLFYSDRTSPYRYIVNRDVTKNSIGLTLRDYQKELDALNKSWASSPVLEIYNYHTRSYGIVDKSNCPYLSSDNLHFTKYAYALYGNSISDFFIDNVLNSNKLYKDDIDQDLLTQLLIKYGLIDPPEEEEEEPEEEAIEEEPTDPADVVDGDAITVDTENEGEDDGEPSEVTDDSANEQDGQENAVDEGPDGASDSNQS